MRTRLLVLMREKKETLRTVLLGVVLFVLLSRYLTGQIAFADYDTAVREMFNAVAHVAQYFCLIMGGLLLLAGFISWGVSHAKGGNNEVSAYIMLASGVVLGLVGVLVIPNIDWNTIFNFSSISDTDVW